MRKVNSLTAPYVELHAVAGALKAQSSALPALAVVSGRPGAGKTTAIQSLIGHYDVCFVRVRAITTVGSLLSSFCRELSLDARRSNPDKLQAIIEELREAPRIVLIDEVDRLTRADERLIEILRDIHDEARVPVILVGEEKIQAKLTRWPQLYSRIDKHIVFGPLDMEDAALVAKDLCEIEIAPDLIERMNEHCEGSIRRIVIALSRFEALAKGNGWNRLDASLWDERPMFLKKGA